MKGVMGGEKDDSVNGSVMAPRQTPCVNGVENGYGSSSGEASVKGGVVPGGKDSSLWDVALKTLESHLGVSFLSHFLNKYSRPFLNIMTVPTLKVGCVGLGRMGKRHAYHFLDKIEEATLVAVCTPDVGEQDWAKENLEPKAVKVYKTFEEMIKHEGLEAVVIASPTSFHKDQTIQAIEAGKHVLCEKPLSLTVEASQKVVDAAAKRPDLKVMCGFSPRFDESYRDAHAKMTQGVVGTPAVFRSQTCDKWDKGGRFIEYSEHSGGIFVDCSIHDIDLCLWFYGMEAKVKSVYAIGNTAKARELRKYNDADNAVGVIEFWDEKIAYLHCSRMMAAGQEDVTEITGTEGKLSVNMSPRKNHVSMHVEGGIVTEIPKDYFERFEKAFITEGIEFAKACLKDTPLPMELSNAVNAIKIGSALQESLNSGLKIEFDKNGNRLDKARL